MGYTLMKNQSDLQAYFSKFNYQIKFCISLSKDWPCYYSSFGYVPIFYENFQFYYNFHYLNKNEKLRDCSFVLMFEKKVIAIVPLILKKNPDNLNSQYPSFRAPLFADFISEKTLKKTLNLLNNFYENCIETGFLQRDFQLKFDFFGNSSNRKAFEYFRKKFVTDSVCIDHIVNVDGLRSLQPDFIRKSYKNLIYNENENLNLKVYNQLLPSEWENFKSLHELVSGRVTRNAETWNIQYEEVNARSSFCVGCYYHEVLVGWALVQVGVSQAIYAVGVYDRNYRNLSISHKIQRRILECLRQSDVDEYILGESYDVTPDDSEYSDKMAHIDLFKRGFSNDTKLKVTLRNKRI